MAYSKDLRWDVVKNVKPGMSWNEVLDCFWRSRQTWSKGLKKGDEGNLSALPRRKYKARKIEVTKRKELVESKADVTLAEDAQHFHGRPQAVANRLKQLGITRKKTPRYRERDEERRPK